MRISLFGNNKFLMRERYSDAIIRKFEDFYNHLMLVMQRTTLFFISQNDGRILCFYLTKLLLALHRKTVCIEHHGSICATTRTTIQCHVRIAFKKQSFYI